LLPWSIILPGVPLVIILMGVVGVGKTTVATALARDLGWEFLDADSFHSTSSIAKIAAGIPLDDADRSPWLASLHTAIQQWLTQHRNVALACSALKQSYRDQLTQGLNSKNANEKDQVKFVYLKASFDVIRQRLQQRQGHFATPDLLPSQLQTLEEPTDAIAINASLSVEEIVTEIRRKLRT
jgi:gluconokinase